MSGNKLTPHAALGRALRGFRLASGLSQEQLGLESSVQRNFISLIETGQNQPTIGTIFRLAAALKVKPSQLVEMAEKLLADEGAQCPPNIRTQIRTKQVAEQEILDSRKNAAIATSQ